MPAKNNSVIEEQYYLYVVSRFDRNVFLTNIFKFLPNGVMTRY